MRENSEALQVSTESTGQTIYRLGGNAKEAKKNGYVYIYVGNESNNLVYFGNLPVTHLKGPLLEACPLWRESHYYPCLRGAVRQAIGTELAAISSRSLSSYVPNRYKANGGAEYGDEEWSNGSGLEMYETFYRSYNAQIGRFMQGDPKMEATVSMSGYVFSGNNPVMFTDLLGDLKAPGYYGSDIPPFYFRSNFFSYMDRNGNKWHHADIMAGTGAAGVPYTEGWGSDGFGDMTTDPGGDGQGVQISWGTNKGVEGHNIYWWEKGELAHGNTLEELRLVFSFKPFSMAMQWDRWEKGM